MKAVIVNAMSEAIQSPKAAILTAGATAANGAATYQQWIELNIGVTSSIVGLIATITLLVIQIKKHYREEREYNLRMRLLERDLGIK